MAHHAKLSTTARATSEGALNKDFLLLSDHKIPYPNRGPMH